MKGLNLLRNIMVVIHSKSFVMNMVVVQQNEKIFFYILFVSICIPLCIGIVVSQLC